MSNGTLPSGSAWITTQLYSTISPITAKFEVAMRAGTTSSNKITYYTGEYDNTIDKKISSGTFRTTFDSNTITINAYENPSSTINSYYLANNIPYYWIALA